MDDGSTFGAPTGDTKRLLVGGVEGDTHVGPSRNVERLLFGVAKRLLTVGLSALGAGRLTLGELTIGAKVVMVRFSDEPVKGL